MSTLMMEKHQNNQVFVHAGKEYCHSKHVCVHYLAEIAKINKFMHTCWCRSCQNKDVFVYSDGGNYQNKQACSRLMMGVVKIGTFVFTLMMEIIKTCTVKDHIFTVKPLQLVSYTVYAPKIGAQCNYSDQRFMRLCQR